MGLGVFFDAVQRRKRVDVDITASSYALLPVGRVLMSIWPALRIISNLPAVLPLSSIKLGVSFRNFGFAARLAEGMLF